MRLGEGLPADVHCSSRFLLKTAAFRQEDGRAAVARSNEV